MQARFISSQCPWLKPGFGNWVVATYCSSVIGQISSSVWPIKYLYQLQICNWRFHLLLRCSCHQPLRSRDSLFLKLSCWSCLQLMSCKNLLLLSSDVLQFKVIGTEAVPINRATAISCFSCPAATIKSECPHFLEHAVRIVQHFLSLHCSTYDSSAHNYKHRESSQPSPL